MTASVCVEHSPSCMLCWPTTASEGDEAVTQGMIAVVWLATGNCPSGRSNLNSGAILDG